MTKRSWDYFYWKKFRKRLNQWMAMSNEELEDAIFWYKQRLYATT